MDDIVVIIITILIAVLGALSQRKKRQTAQEQGKTQQQKPFDFWEMLNDQGTAEDPYQHYEPETEIEEEPLDVVPEKKPVYQFSASREGSSDITETQFKEPVRTKRKVLVDGEKFSLRKAVIYNEIMNRKYR